MLEMDAHEFRRKYLGEHLPSANKYHAVKTVSNGIRYDSKYEAEVAAQLDLMLRAGELRWILRQVRVPLGPDFAYRVDFIVQDKDYRLYGIEAKGMETRDWKRAEQLWAKYGPFELCVYRRGRPQQWIQPVEVGAGSHGQN